jgi:histone H3/H4
MKNIMRHAGVPMIGKDGAEVFANLAKLILTNIATSAEREAHFAGRVTVKYKDTVQALRRAKMIAPFVLAKQKKRAAHKHKVAEKTQNV